MPPLVSEDHYDLLRDAIFDNNADRFAELLAVEGLDVDHFDAGGQTMLHLASFWGRMPLVKLLLNNGASLKAKNAAGCTALDLATHWGHSSVAEIIRLRGGRSVWEDKMGQLQIRVEDLKLQNGQLLQQYHEKKRQHEELLDEYHGLHRRHEEEKSANCVTRAELRETQQQRDAVTAEKETLLAQLGDLTDRFRDTTVDKARSDALRDQAVRELQAAVAHRDDALTTMQQSIAKQQEITQYWQQAEIAAAIADSQRNFTHGEKERLQKQHTAALGELLVATERLHAAEQELMTLRVELAEYIYGKEKDQRILRRAALVLTRTEGITTAELAFRPHTTPVRNLGPKQLAEGPPTSEPLGPILNARKKAQFSKAAQEYGDKVRENERKRFVERQRRHQVLENQYLTHGLSTPVVASDKFQEGFVTSLNAFAAKRDEKWIALDHDRERQHRLAQNAMARRTITTAPLPLRRRGSENRYQDFQVPREDRAASQTIGGADGEEQPVSSRTLLPLRRKASRLATVISVDEMEGEKEPERLQSEQRMRAAFFN